MHSAIIFAASTSLLLVATSTYFVSAADISPSGYANKRSITSQLNFYWTINGGTLEAALESVGTVNGWMGFGVAEPTSGSMPGSDIVVVQNIGATPIIKDYFATGFTTPTEDCGGNDWTLVGTATNVSASVVRFSRSLAVSNTKEDRSIDNNGKGTKLVFAWGTPSQLSYHGTVNRAFFELDLFSSVTPTVLTQLASRGNIETTLWKMNNKEIPAQTTDPYVYSQCIPAPAVHANGSRPFALAIEVSADPSTSEYLHHLILYGSSRSVCTSDPTQYTNIFGVASKTTPMIFPDNVGLDLTMFQAYMIEIHFYNPNLRTGILDNTGVKIYWTYSPVMYRANLLILGDPLVMLRGTSLTLGSNYSRFSCPGSCTQSLMNGSITLTGGLFHMHKYGDYIRTDIWSGNDTSVAPAKSLVSEYYSFHLQENRPLDTPIVLNPGDTLRTTCGYKSTTNSLVKWGMGSDDEMCQHFVFYYPAENFHDTSKCGLGFCGSYDGALPHNFTRDFGQCDLGGVSGASSVFSIVGIVVVLAGALLALF